MGLQNCRNGHVLATQIEFATTFKARLKGLLGRPSLPPGNALVLHPCSSIHTFFMRFAIDVLFLNGDFEVVAVLESLSPYRASKIYRHSRVVVELPAGVVQETDTKAGDKLNFSL